MASTTWDGHLCRNKARPSATSLSHTPGFRLVYTEALPRTPRTLQVEAKRGAPFSSHNFSSLSNISNILRYLYEKPPHNNRKCGLQVEATHRHRARGAPLKHPTVHALVKALLPVMLHNFIFRITITDFIHFLVKALLPVMLHNFINLSNISNILRHLYGRTHT